MSVSSSLQFSSSRKKNNKPLGVSYSLGTMKDTSFLLQLFYSYSCGEFLVGKLIVRSRILELSFPFAKPGP